jgi:arginine deiminase
MTITQNGAVIGTFRVWEDMETRAELWRVLRYRTFEDSDVFTITRVSDIGTSERLTISGAQLLAED